MDGRKNNGNKGHSTKAKGVDRRKNQYKTVIQDTISKEDLAEVLKMLLTKSIEKQDTKAAQLLLEHCIGRPEVKADITTDGEKINFNIKDIVAFRR